MTIFLTRDPRFVLAQFTDTVPVTYSIIDRRTSINKNGCVCVEESDDGKICWDDAEPEMVKDGNGNTVISADVRFGHEWQTVPITACSIVRANRTVSPLLWTKGDGIHIQS